MSNDLQAEAQRQVVKRSMLAYLTTLGFLVGGPAGAGIGAKIAKALNVAGDLADR